MSGILKNNWAIAFCDAIAITFVLLLAFYSNSIYMITFCALAWFLTITMAFLYAKGAYKKCSCKFCSIYNIFESIVMANIIAGIPFYLSGSETFILSMVLLSIIAILEFIAVIVARGAFYCFKFVFHRSNNVLIVGAGQDGKLIAEEIQSRPNLGMKVVGFLDDNMNNIEDEDSSIPILGLTCDSEAVIKDNNVKTVIVSVKSRMDSDILTDLVKGIPLGVKVWRMPKFYEKISHKYLISKMTVNWLFYSCVRKKALLFAHIKRFCDILASLFIMLLTIPLSLLAVIIIKLADFGPIFYTQTRIGQFGKPFEMIKFRTMYQKEVQDDFDDDLNEVSANDKRIMPFCKILRKFHIDEIPQMINVLRGDMSIVGPRPVREEVYYENKDKIPFWESRNWVRPGWCGWQQVKKSEPTYEERLAYDLFYIKHRNIFWEFIILVRYTIMVLCGKG